MIEVAMFGAGRIGKIHGANVAGQPGVKLKYVVDVSAASASELAQKHGAKVVDANAALMDPAVKAVVIASSTDTHADLIMRAAAASSGQRTAFFSTCSSFTERRSIWATIS